MPLQAPSLTFSPDSLPFPLFKAHPKSHFLHEALADNPIVIENIV